MIGKGMEGFGEREGDWGFGIKKMLEETLSDLQN